MLSFTDKIEFGTDIDIYLEENVIAEANVTAVVSYSLNYNGEEWTLEIDKTEINGWDDYGKRILIDTSKNYKIDDQIDKAFNKSCRDDIVRGAGDLFVASMADAKRDNKEC